MKLGDKLKTGLVIGALGLAVAGSSGCAGRRGDAFARSVGRQMVRDVVRNSIESHYAGPRGTVVNVGGAKRRNDDTYLIFRKWKDFNGDGIPSKEELVGKVNYSIDLSKTSLCAWVNHMELVSYYSLSDSNNNLIAKSYGVAVGVPEGNYTDSEYFLRAHLKNGETISRSFRTTK